MGRCCVQCVCVAHHCWVCYYSGLVFLAQRDALLALNMPAPAGEGEFLLCQKKIQFQSQIAELFFSLLSGDMKERACLSTLAPSTCLSCPKEPMVFLDRHLPPSFSCLKTSKSHPWKRFSNHNEAILWGFVMVRCPRRSQRTFSAPAKWAFTCSSIFFRWNTPGSLFTSFTSPKFYQGSDPRLFH